MPFPRSLSGGMKDRSLLLFCGLAAAAALFLTVSNTGQAFAELSPTHLQDAAASATAVDHAPRAFSRSIGDSVSVASNFDNLGARIPRVFNVGISDGLNIATSPTPPPPSSAATNTTTTARPSTGLQQGMGRAEEKLGPRNPIESKGDPTSKDPKDSSVQEQPQGSISQELESVLSTLMQDLLGSDDSEPDDSSSSNNTAAVQVPPTIYIDSLYGAYAMAIIVISVGKSPRVARVRRQIVALYALESPEDKQRDAEMPMYARVAIIVIVIVAAVAMASAVEPVMGEAFADTNKAAIVYIEGSTPKYREWIPSAGGGGSWSSPVSLTAADTTLNTAKIEFSPVSSKRVIVTMDNNGNLDSYVCSIGCTDASSWTFTNNFVDVTASTVTASYRPWDIEYEHTSGDLMIVYDYPESGSSATDDLFYRIMTNSQTSFGSESSINDSGNSATAGLYSFVAMDSQKTSGSDEMALIAVDATASDASAIVWNGNNWTTLPQTELSTSVSIATEEAVAIAYETNSGDILVVAGEGSNIRYNTFSNTSNTWGTSSTSAGTWAVGTINWVRLVPDPRSTSNAIFLAGSGSSNDLDSAYWSGSAWTDHAEHDAGISGNAARVFDFAWDGSSSNGVLAWSTASNSISFTRGDPSSGTFGTDGTFTVDADASTTSWIRLASNPTTADTVAALGLEDDGNSDIGGIRWDGSTNAPVSTGTDDISTTSTNNSWEPFSIDFQKVVAIATKNISDTIATSPSIVAAKFKVASIPQTITITPTIVKKVTRSLPNTVTVSDSIARSVTVTPDTTPAAMAYRSDDGTNGSSSPKYREWNPTTKTWGSQVELESAGSPIRNAWIEFSPVSTKRVIIVLSEDGTLDSYACDFGCTIPSSWTVTHDIVDLWNVVTPAAQKRPFDIEFEKTSGDLMLVYDKEDGGDPATDLFYRIMPDSSHTFGSESVIDDTDTAAPDNVYSFIRLDSRRTPGSNDLGLVAESETNHRAVAWYWNGSTDTFGNMITLTTSVSTDVDYEGVGIGFETSTGDLVAVAAEGANVVYAQFSGGSWSTPANVGTLNVSTVRWVRFVPNPNAGTDGIQLVVSGYTGSAHQLNSAYWNATGWKIHAGETRHDASIDDSATRVFDFAWDNAGDATRGILVWGNGNNNMVFKRYTVPDTWTTIDFGAGAISDDGTHPWVSLNEHGNPISADAVSVLGAAIDNGADIGQLRWDGSASSVASWTDDGATAVGNTSSESFHVDFRRSPVLKKFPSIALTVADTLAAKIKTKVFSETVTFTVSLEAEKGSPTDSARSAAVYRSNTGTALLNSPKYREWNPATQAWSAEVELANTGSPVRDALIRFSPDSSLRVVVSHSDDGTLNLFKCDSSCTSASSWTLVAADFADTGTTNSAKPYRPYDILFETTGERLVIVYDKELTEDADFYYRTFDGTTLSGETGVNLGGAADAEELRYLHLAAHPTTNEMTVAILDATNLRSYGAVWSGSAWGNVQTVSSSLSIENADGDSVDVAYETLTGASLVFSGNGGNSAAYARWTGSSWTTGTTNPNPGVTSEDVKFVSLKSDPLSSSNKVMACQGDDESDLSCSQFAAGTPGAWTLITTNTGTAAGRAFDFAYNPAGTTGLLVSSSGASGTLDYRAFNGTGFGNASTLSAAGTHKWVLGASAISATDVVNSMFLKSNSNFDTGAIRSKAGTTALIGDASLTGDSGNDTYESMHIDFQKSKRVKRASADTITVAPAVTRGLGKSLSDTVTIAPAVSKAVGKPVSDTITVSAVAAKNPTVTIPLSITVTDSVRKRVTRSVTDTITVGDSITKHIIYSPSVALSINDSVARHVSATRSVADTVAIGVSAGGAYHASRPVSDTLSVSPDVARAYHATRSASVSLSVSDAIAKSITRSLSDTVTVAPSIGRAYSPSRSLSDTVTVAPEVARAYLASRSMAETLSVSDAVAGTSAFAREIADSVSFATAVSSSASRSLPNTISITDSISPTTGRSLANTISLADAITTRTSRSVSDSVAVTDSIARRASRSLADSLSATDSISRRASRSAAETVSVTDAIATTAKRSLADTLSVADAISTSAIRALANTVSLTDAINTRTSRSLSDSISVAETLSGIAARPLSTTITVTDAISILSTRNISDTVTVMAEILQEGRRSVDSNVSISDSISTKVSRTLSDLLSLADSAKPNVNRRLLTSLTVTDAISQTVSRSLADSLSLSDAVSTAVTRSLSDALDLTDAIAKSVSRSTSDSIGIADAISARTSRSLSDSIAVTDSVATRTSRPVSDALAVTDAVRTSVSRSISDSLSVDAAVSTSVSRFLSDSLSVTDAIAKSVSHSLSDSIAVADAIAKSVSRSVSETVGVTDAITRSASRSLSDPVVLADAITTAVSRSIADTIPVTDAIVPNSRRSMSDTLTLADSISHTASRSVSETLSLTDAVSTTASRSMADSVAVTDAIAKSVSRSIADSVTVAATANSGPSRSSSDSISLSDAVSVKVSRSISDSVTVISEILQEGKRSADVSIAISDAITIAVSRSLADSVSLASNITTAVSRSLSDTVTVADSISRSVSRSLSDSISATDAISTTVSRSLADSLSITPAINSTTSRSLADSVSIADAIITSASRSLSDNIALADSISTSVSRSLADTVSVADAIARAAADSRSPSDSIAATDAIATTASRSISDALSVTDALSSRAIRSLSETLSVTDIVASRTSRSLSDAITVADAIAKSVSRSMSETVGITDAVSTSASRSASDSVAVADSISTATSRSLQDALSITDAASPTGVRSLSETVAIADSISRSVSRSISDTLTVASAIVPTTSSGLADALAITDAIGRSISRSIADTLTVTPSANSGATPAVFDSVAVTASVSIGVSRSISDSVTVISEILQEGARTADVSIIVGDAITTRVSRSISDALSVTADDMLKSMSRSPSDTVTVADAITGKTSRSLSDALSLADGISTSTSRSLDDAVSMTDSISRAVSRSIVDALAPADSVSTAVTRSLADSVAVADTALGKSVFRSASDTIALEDKISMAVTRSVTEAVTLADSAVQSTGSKLFDSVAVGDHISTSVSRTVSEVLSMADAASESTSRPVADALSVTDAVKISVAGAVSDSVAASDVIKMSVSRSVADSATVSDAMATSGDRSPAETVSVTDAISMSASRSVSDALAVSDNASRAPALAVADTLAVADAISTSNSYSVTVSDTVSAADSMTRALGASRLAGDALATTDAIGTPASLARAISDTLAVADAALAGGSINVPISDLLTVSDAIAKAGSGPFSDAVAVTDAVSIGISRSIEDAMSMADSVVPPVMRAMGDAVAIADQVSAMMGTAVSIADSVGINSQITNVSVHWNRVFEEGVNLADCTPFSCNQSLHFDEGLSLADDDFFTSPPGRVLPASIAVTDSIGVNRPQTFISLADSVEVSPAVKPLLPILVNNHADDHGRPPNFSVPGNYTWDGTPASLRDALELEPLYFNTTVNRDNLPNQIITLRLWDVAIVPTANLPANNTLISDRAANIPAGVPVQVRVNFMDTPSLSRHSDFIRSLDVQFTPAMLTTDFGLIVTPMDAPPAGASVPPEELRPLYIDVRWWGNVPGGSDPSVQSYYQNPPTFTFTVTDEWARSESAVRDANGVPLIKLRLLNEATNQWEEINTVQRPTSSANDGTYTFTATLPHFSDYVITAVKSATSGSGSSSSTPPVKPRIFAVNLVDSIALATSSSSKAVGEIIEFVNEKFSANLLDSVVVSSKPVAYNTFKILKDVEVSITVVDVRQESVAPPSATAVIQTDITNAGDLAEKFTLNFWYNDQTGKRAFDLSQQVDVEAHGFKTLQVTIPFTEPGTYRVTAEARSVPENDLLESTQLTVVVPWLSVYLYVLMTVAIAILGGSAIAIALYMARNGMAIAAGAGAAGALILLLGRKRKPRVRVAEKRPVDYDYDDGDGNGNGGDDDYDLLVNVKLANGSEGRLAPGERMALFDFEIINKSRRKQEFVLAYHLVDMAGAAMMPESVAEVKIAKHKTQLRNAKLELLAGAYVLHVEARTARGEVLSSDRVSVRTA
ncbi:hypothetical protein [Nitrososphaera viennensis]|uniref:Uncharacterized protein n=2 Tax=Nitrososphaera viennensis TaxID=1034015 RepID=A0A977IDZ1_9ARCH|nr:hypothetical protein [Nitrososphaera viennensis]UVS69279.1 hypothetical protein NWT39_00480 [Nitrososphaera viennensis]